MPKAAKRAGKTKAKKVTRVKKAVTSKAKMKKVGVKKTAVKRTAKAKARPAKSLGVQDLTTVQGGLSAQPPTPEGSPKIEATVSTPPDPILGTTFDKI